MACGTDEGSIHIWDLGSARRVATLQGHVGPVWSLAYSCGSGAVLASGVYVGVLSWCFGGFWVCFGDADARQN